MRSLLTGKYLFALITLFVFLAATSTTAFAASDPPAGAMVVVVGDSEARGSIEDLTRYNKNMDIWKMLMFVAFLMCFIRKFEWGVFLASLLSAASTYISYLLIQQLFFRMPMEVVFGQDMMIMAVVCAIALVIAIGMFLGTLKMWQYIVVGILFAPAFVGIEYILLGLLEAQEIFGPGYVDPGGGILVHLFAACWGFGVIIALRDKRAFEDPMYTTKHSVTFVWLAAMFLFVLWPSFVTSLMPTADVTNVMANCWMSGLGSIIAAYIVNMICSKKVNALVYCYAFLGGLVASSSSLLNSNPWFCLMVGAVGGVAVTLSIIYLHPWLCKKLGALDVMGVHNLHGVGGWVSLIFGAILVGSFVNIIGGVITLVYGLVVGGVTGIILRVTRGEMKLIFTDDSDFEGHNPHPILEPNLEKLEAEAKKM
jgi:ammonium transporter Rh